MTPRRRLCLAGLLAVLQVAATFGAATGQPERQGVDALAVALLLVGPVTLLLGGRWPLVPVAGSAAAACVFIGLGYPFGPIFASVVVSIFLAVQAGRRRGVVVLAVAAYLGFCVAVELDDRGDGLHWTHMLIVAGWVVAVLSVSEIVRVRREQLAARRQREREAERRALADQRMQLAQELHDVLAHHISLINVQANMALRLLDSQPERAAEALTHIKRASVESLGELRAAVEVLRDGASPRTPAPGLADVPELVDGVRAGGLDVRLEMTEVRSALPAAVEQAAYRIVQEALTNVTRHSTADRVDVRITVDGNDLLVAVEDNGRGASLPSGRAGSGLLGMRERAQALGGAVTVAATATGFAVTARLPWQSGE